MISGFFGLMCYALPYDWAAVLVRLAAGCALLPHGIEKFRKRHQPVQFPRVWFFSPVAGFKTIMVIEIVVPLFMIAGLCTRLVAIPAIFAMYLATRHSGKHFFSSPALVFLLLFIAVFLIGAGDISLDAVLGRAVARK